MHTTRLLSWDGDEVAFLSEVRLNPLRRGTQRLVASPQRIHAAVEGVAPPGERRVLWRLERKEHEYCLLIQSPEVPSLEHIVDQAGWPDTASGTPRVADLSQLLRSAAIGREFGFKIKLNTVSSSKTVSSPTAGQSRQLEGARRSVRLGHRTISHQMAWFVEKFGQGSSDWGFEVLDKLAEPLTIVSREQLCFPRRESGKVTLDTATFQGVLRVSDRERFQTVIQSGIGKAKAYGCGLLTLAPAC